MREIFILFIGAIMLSSCSKSDTPKQIVSDFVIAVKKMNFEKAQNLITEETKSLFADSKLKFQNSPSFSEEMKKSSELKESEIVSLFGLDKLSELVLDKNATVYTKDSSNKIQLENISGKWKIICTKDLTNSILNGDNVLKVVSEAYSVLQNQYKRRNDLLKQVLGQGQNIEMSNELNKLETLSTDISEMNAYIENQESIGKKVIQHLMLNYSGNEVMFEIEGMENRIRKAKDELNFTIFSNNKGFGKKIEFLKADTSSRQAPMIKF